MQRRCRRTRSPARSVRRRPRRTRPAGSDPRWPARAREVAVVAARLAARACRDDCRNDAPSSRNATRQHDVADRDSPRPAPGRSRSRIPCLIDTAAPATNKPERREQRPDVDLPPVAQSDARRRRAAAPRRLAISRKIWLPVSAQECAASATIDADPDSTAATVLATATHRFATNATSTVRLLSPAGSAVDVSVTASLWTRSGQDASVSPAGPSGVGTSLVRPVGAILVALGRIAVDVVERVVPAAVSAHSACLPDGPVFDTG